MARTKEPYYEERIRYVEDWNGDGEHYVFEGKWSNEEEWGLDSAFKIFPFEDEKETTMIHYTALTKIRSLMKMGIPFYFC